MNIHLPAILMFTRGTRFWHTAKWWWDYPIVHHWCYPKQWKTPKLSTFPFSSSSERLPNNLWWGVVWWVSQATITCPSPSQGPLHITCPFFLIRIRIVFPPRENANARSSWMFYMYILYHFVTLARSDLHVVRPRSVLGGLPVAHWSSPAPNSSMFELRWSTGFSGFPRSCGGLDNKGTIKHGEYVFQTCRMRETLCRLSFSSKWLWYYDFSSRTQLSVFFSPVHTGFKWFSEFVRFVAGSWWTMVRLTRWFGGFSNTLDCLCMSMCTYRWSHSSNVFFFWEWIGSSRRFFRQLLFSRWTHFFWTATLACKNGCSCWLDMRKSKPAQFQTELRMPNRFQN